MDPHTPRSEAERWLGIAEKLLASRDLVGSRSFAIRARESDPTNPTSEQILAVVDTLMAAEKRVINSGHYDWYSILQLSHLVRDPDLIASHYRRLVLLLNPDHNHLPYADFAIRVVFDAWSVLSDPAKKWMYDSELAVFLQRGNDTSEAARVDSSSASAATYQFFHQPTQQQQPWIQHHLQQEEPVQTQQLFQNQQQQQQRSEWEQQQHRSSQWLPQHQHQQPIAQRPQQWLPEQQRPPPPPPQALQQQQTKEPAQFPPQLQRQQPIEPAQFLPQLQRQHQQQQPKSPPPQLQRQQQPKSPPPQLQRQQQSKEPQFPPQLQRQQQQSKEPQFPPQLQRQQQQQQPTSPPQLQRQQQQQPKEPTQFPPQLQRQQPAEPQFPPQLQRQQQQQPAESQILPQLQRQQESQIPPQLQRQQPQTQPQQQNKTPTPPPPAPAPPQQTTPPHRPLQQMQKENNVRSKEDGIGRGGNVVNEKVNDNGDMRSDGNDVVDNGDYHDDGGIAGSFWTACPYCYHLYEYSKAFEECTLRCQNCRRAFQAVQVPNPPGAGDEASFCSWGFFPIGFSMTSWKKSVPSGNGVGANWTPFSPMIACPVQQGVKTKKWTIVDASDEEEDLEVSSDDSDSSGEWGSNRKKVKRANGRSKRGRPPGRKSNAEREKMANQRSAGGENSQIPRNDVVNNNTTNTAVASGSLKKQTGKGVRGRKKLDLNVEFSNEVEDHAAAARDGNGEEIGFFEGLDEFLSTLPILHVVGDDKAKPS